MKYLIILFLAVILSSCGETCDPVYTAHFADGSTKVIGTRLGGKYTNKMMERETYRINATYLTAGCDTIYINKSIR